MNSNADHKWSAETEWFMLCSCQMHVSLCWKKKKIASKYCILLTSHKR